MRHDLHTNDDRATPHFPFAEGGFGALGGSPRLAPAIAETPLSDGLDDGEGVGTGYVGLTVDGRRLSGAFLALILLLTAVAARAGQLQVADGETYRSQAEGNRSRIEWMPAERGIVYDRNGVPLVANVPTFTAAIVPVDLPKEEAGRREVIGGVAEVLGLAPMDIEERIDAVGRTSTEPAIVHEDLTHEQSVLLAIAGTRWPSVTVRTGTRREYRYAETAGSLAHVLGYEGRLSPSEVDERVAEGYLRTDLIGKTGLERWYEDRLRGIYGRRRIEVDATGREKTVIAEEPSVSGTNLVLAIDLDLQEQAEAALRRSLAQNAKKRGSVIVLRPGTGEVLAMVSLPAFDNNLFAKGISLEEFAALNENADNPMFARAIAASLASGSVFKPVVAAAALDEDVVTPVSSFLSAGGIRVGQWFFPDWKGGGHGITNLAKALAESVNTYFYIVGGGFEDRQGLGVERIVAYAKRFGFGSALGIDLPGENAGFLPTKEWKEEAKRERWYIGDTYHVAIGQGDILVTPLQVAAMTAAFANGGALVQPHVVNAFTTNDGTRTVVEPTVLDPQVVSPEAIAEVRKGMRMAVTSGSARSLSLLPVAAAGKTGTAQWSSTKAPHAWFTSFAPYEDPELVITVTVEEGVEGSVAATPVARDIYAWYFARNR
jgi:penicillin-binding protein 2